MLCNERMILDVHACDFLPTSYSDDPKKFLASFFRDLIAARDGHAPGVSPTIVSEENIVSMYETIDVNNTGYITFNQYKEGKVYVLPRYAANDATIRLYAAGRDCM